MVSDAISPPQSATILAKGTPHGHTHTGMAAGRTYRIASPHDRKGTDGPPRPARRLWLGPLHPPGDQGRAVHRRGVREARPPADPRRPRRGAAPAPGPDVQGIPAGSGPR